VLVLIMVGELVPLLSGACLALGEVSNGLGEILLFLTELNAHGVLLVGG
jgi:hypothetical protein